MTEQAMEQGLVQVYTGSGKGKTTAAIGLATRALGHGLRVLLVRFLKPATPESGEVLLLRQLPGVEILSSGVGILGSTPDRSAVVASVAATFAAARERILSGAIDMAILDEINNAVHHGYLPLAELLALLAARPATMELILTGRHAHPEILAQADLVTEMVAHTHPYRRGIPARRGSEY